MFAHPCTEGHRWRQMGGRNCGCHPDAQCSMPVNQCEVCGDFDYGDNPEAEQQRAACPEVEECRQKGPALANLYLTREEFEALPEYSATLPTGTTPGKRWRRHDGAFDAELIAAGGKPKWMIGEFDPHDDGKGSTIKLNWYWPILIVPGTEAAHPRAPEMCPECRTPGHPYGCQCGVPNAHPPCGACEQGQLRCPSCDHKWLANV